MRRPVKLFKVDIDFSEADSIHAATNIHAHHIGNHLINNGHGGADGTSLSGVYVRHNSNFGGCERFFVAYRLNLLAGAIFELVCIALSGVVFSYDLYHDDFLSEKSIEGKTI